MRLIKRLCCLCVCSSCVYSVLADAPAYFRSVDVELTAPPSLHVQVIGIEKESLAKKAGIAIGDIIVGIDGLRTDTITDFRYAWRIVQDRDAIDFAFLRKGKVITIPVTGLKAAGQVGITFVQKGPKFIESLQSLNINLDEIVGSPLPRLAKDLAKSEFSSFPVSDGASTTEPFVYRQPLLAFDNFPGRAHESILSFNSTDDASFRQWLTRLLTVYHLLLQQRYEDALKIVEDHELEKTDVDPFLNRLLQFYKTVAATPPRKDGSLDIADFDCDIAMIAICYPYPLTPMRADENGFRDPLLQKAFDLSTSGLDTQDGAVFALASDLYSNTDRTGTGGGYLASVKQALVAPKHHGGWPFRITTVFDERSREAIIAELAPRMRNPDDKDSLAAAYAILSPALINKNVALFAEAYDLVYRAGDREIAVANSMIFFARQAWRIRDKRFDKVISNYVGKSSVPPIYNYLASQSEEVVERMRRGVFLRDNYVIMDLAAYCCRNPWLIAQALTK